MESGPLVSVLMTAYNRAQFIAEAIESVLASTWQNFELIIVDDCSHDDTVAIAKKYELLDSRIKLYVNEKNLGDYPNRNKAASYAKGKYLMSLDSDDIMNKDGIEKCMNAMLKFHHIKFAAYYRLPATEPFLCDSKTAIQNHFFKEPYLLIGPGGTIIERDYFNEINGFPEKYGPANDSYYNLKAVAKTPVLLLPFQFLFYRIHAGQEINNSYGYLCNNYRYLDDALNELDLHLTLTQTKWLHKKNKRRFLINIFKYFIQSKNFGKTMAAIKNAKFSFKDGLLGIFH